jgi:predicted enzyme related to lactoylglutathione lyase
MHRIFLLSCLLFVFACNSRMTQMKVTFESFVSAVNAHDSAAIGGLLAANHLFCSTDGAQHAPAAAMETWNEYFRLFPDFSLKIGSVTETDSGIAAFGALSGSLLQKKDSTYSFELPVAIHASFENGKVSHWQFYGNDQKILDLVALANGRRHSDLSVQALGGVFFKSKDPKTLCAWYDKHLGTQFGDGTYAIFEWRDHASSGLTGSTTYAIFDEKSDYFAPGNASFMFNFRVNNLDAVMEKLKADGVQPVGEIQRFDYGNFGWIMDIDGNKIELWEPIDGVLEDYEKDQTN